MKATANGSANAIGRQNNAATSMITPLGLYTRFERREMPLPMWPSRHSAGRVNLPGSCEDLVVLAQLVPGDPHLLAVGQYEGTRSARPRAFLDLLGS